MRTNKEIFDSETENCYAKNIMSIVVLAMVIIVAAVYLFSGKVQRKENKDEFRNQISKFNKDIEIPEKFPKDLPVAELNLIEAYSRDKDTKDIVTVFDSKKPAKENYDYYLNYMKTSGWTIDDAIELKDSFPAGISARKENFFINMAFEPKENNISKITISSKLIKPINNIDFKGMKLK